MAEKEMATQQPPQPDKLPELAQLIMENEKLRRKHRKVQHRRDHYARLYYRCQADLDEKRWELHFARIKIKELKAQIAAGSLPLTSSLEHRPPLPSSSSSHSDIVPHPSRGAQHHYLTQSHPHSYSQNNKYQHSQPLQDTPSKISAPGSIPSRPGHIPCRRSESDSTSPDSGASFSPGMGTGNGIDPLHHSHPTASFPHSHSHNTPQGSKSKTLPHSMHFNQRTNVSTAGTNAFASGRERKGQSLEKRGGRGGEDGGVDESKSEGEDWVAWVKGRNLPAQYKVGMSDPPTPLRPQDEWRGEKGRREEVGREEVRVRREEVGGVSQERGGRDKVRDDSTTTPRSLIVFKNSAPPSNDVASPLATHRRHPTFPLGQGFSLSQGTSLPRSGPLSPPLTHSQHRKQGGHPVNFSLSQEGYVSSPLYIRKPAFNAAHHKEMRSQVISDIPEGRGECQSPLPSDSPPLHKEAEPVSYSDQEPLQPEVQSAFRKLPVHRQLSHPAHLVSPTQYHHQTRDLNFSPPSTNPLPDGHQPPPHTSLQSPPLLSTHPHPSHPPPPATGQSRFLPPPPPTSLPPPLPTSHTHSHTHVSSNPRNSQSPQSPVGVGAVNLHRDLPNPHMGVVSKPMATSASLTDQSRNCQIPTIERDEHGRSEEEEDDETDDEGTEGGEGGEGEEDSCYEHLTMMQMFDLLSKIGDPKCTIRKLEVADCGLGTPEAMAALCRDLRRNKSLQQLSLPNNGIGAESLQLLLDCIQHCTNIRELKLRGNNIGKRCAPLIKALMEQTSLDSLVLTGNEIEQYGDLLHRALPSDFTMEYDTAEGSVDSGVVVAETEQFNNGHTSLKYLHV